MTSKDRTESYVGLTGTTFKERFRNHEADLRKSTSKPCKLVNYVINLKEINIEFSIKWSILTIFSHHQPMYLCINFIFYTIQNYVHSIQGQN